MFYFASRDRARAFARKIGRKLVDLGSAGRRRWAVQAV